MICRVKLNKIKDLVAFIEETLPQMEFEMRDGQEAEVLKLAVPREFMDEVLEITLDADTTSGNP